ncbi:acyl-CoA-binding protein (ACBP)/diazepam binding inhibitor (DBI)/endozepine (EP) [Umbelopsis sp. WA50703]
MSSADEQSFHQYVNQRYKRALGLVRNIPKKSLFQPSNADKLKLYGLYKQASFGDINIPQPDRWDLLARAKWYVQLKRNGDILLCVAVQLMAGQLFIGKHGTSSKA